MSLTHQELALPLFRSMADVVPFGPSHVTYDLHGRPKLRLVSSPPAMEMERDGEEGRMGEEEASSFLPRRFYLVREEDITGVSGTGIIAEGTLYSEGTGGKVTLAWCTQYKSVGIYDSLEQMLAIHGHGGATHIEWIDV